MLSFIIIILFEYLELFYHFCLNHTKSFDLNLCFDYIFLFVQKDAVNGRRSISCLHPLHILYIYCTPSDANKNLFLRSFYITERKDETHPLQSFQKVTFQASIFCIYNKIYSLLI